ncbi:MAG: hypothetical protein C0591_03520 [Marinilabiliales bacterium]|nr:MAG: hypothetical protein C0591_03520 [Marinilabiliales bacterium]
MMILWFGLRKSYQNTFEKLEDKRFIFYETPYLNYYNFNYDCPSSFEALLEFLQLNRSDYQYLINESFIDYLARGNDTLIRYYPIYNRKNKKRESFVLLSAGIDGSHDNDIKQEDTLFIDNWTTKIIAYNPETYEKTGDTIRNYNPNFNIYNYYFGSKDLIIQYVDCVQRFKNRARYTYTVNEFIELVKENDKRDLERKVIKLKLINQDDSLSVLKKGEYFYFNYGDFLIQFNLASKIDKENVIDNTNLILGKISEINKSEKKIILTNCFIVE